MTRLDRILALPSWPIDFVLARNLDAILLINRRLMDASPAVVLKHRVEVVKKHLELASVQEFLQSRGSSNKLVSYVNVTGAWHVIFSLRHSFLFRRAFGVCSDLLCGYPPASTRLDFAERCLFTIILSFDSSAVPTRANQHARAARK